MQVQPRTLGYLNAKELPVDKLGQISGGSSTLSCETTNKLSGQSPGPIDVTTDQIWD